MERKIRSLMVFAMLLIPLVASACSKDEESLPAKLIIDHTCTDLSQIPDEWIDSAQANLKIHYAHTSHGGQLTTGLSRIEVADAKYSVAITNSSLPTESGALCIFDGQETETYITPELYWQSQEGMNLTRDVLDHNPSINISMWSWCTQLYSYNEQQTQEYLDSMAVLESEYPGVTFIYMTCNAQSTDASGYNRYLRNEQIRKYCEDNDKILFDFADLDAWWYNPSSHAWEHATYEYESTDVPVEHEQFHGDEAAHTTYESCEQKGRAVWWMMARLAGWAGGVDAAEVNTPSMQYSLAQNSPNPFASSTVISYTLPMASDVSLVIYDAGGRVIRTFAEGSKSAGTHSVNWDGLDSEGKAVPNGAYFCQLRSAVNVEAMRPMLLLK
jgi:hypothetical protein